MITKHLMVFLLKYSRGVRTFAGYGSVDPGLLGFAASMVCQDGLVAGLLELNEARIVYCFGARSDTEVPRQRTLVLALAQFNFLGFSRVGEEHRRAIDYGEWSVLLIATQACCVDCLSAYSDGDKWIPAIF
jgi:hypothetical protein